MDVRSLPVAFLLPPAKEASGVALPCEIRLCIYYQLVAMFELVSFSSLWHWCACVLASTIQEQFLVPIP